MKLFSSVVQPVFLRSNKCSQTSSTVRPLTDPSTQMRLLPMVPLYKLPFLMVKVQRLLKISYFSTLFLSLKVSKQLVVLWPFLFLEIQLFQQRRTKLSQPMLIINLVSSFRSSKVNVVCQKIAIFLVSSTLKAFPQHPVVLLKLR